MRIILIFYSSPHIVLHKNILWNQVEYYNDDNIPYDPPLKEFKSHTEGIYKISKHPIKSSYTFASCSVDMTIKLWDLDKNESPIHELIGHFGYVVDIAFNAKGTHHLCKIKYIKQLIDQILFQKYFLDIVCKFDSYHNSSFLK